MTSPIEPAQGNRVRRSLPGGVLRTLRLERQLSQLQVAVLAGVDAGHIYRLENGFHYPRPNMVWRLSQGLGIPLEDLTRALATGAPDRSPDGDDVCHTT